MKKTKPIRIKAKFDDPDPSRIVSHVQQAVNNAMSIDQAAEVPPQERRERRLLNNISDYHLRHAADTELGIRPEDRASFMLGWLACAERVRGTLRNQE